MRKNRVIEQNRCYHLVSRLAHRAFFLDDEEKDRAVALMRRVEEFSGVVVLAYAFMSNHFHIFIYVPSVEEIGEGEILRRIRVLYHDASLSQVVATWNRLKTEEQELFKRARPTKKYVSRFEAYKSSFLRRMWNSAEFMRTFKQHFTMSFNGRREHSGTMFEGRYHERNHLAEGPAMWRTSAYIDINAWEAGIAERPEGYRWCSFAAAVRGDRKARAGYAFMYGGGEWRVIRECHEQSMQEAMGEVLKAREAEKEECRAGRGASPSSSKADPRLDIPDKVGIGLGKGSERTAKRILELLVDGPMRPSALREAVGIKSPIHFSRYYLRPLMEKGMIERTDPDSPKSPRQEYKLA
ncbi:MAG: transposase [Kiritimatiellae bacterium]|nr:transposase [Kiritimatiellia bacterium]